MYVTHIYIDGFRAAPDLERPLGRVVELPPGPKGVAVADALDVIVASLSPERTVGALGRLGLGRGSPSSVLVEDGLVVQFDVADASAARALLTPHGRRKLAVRVLIEPDPPFFGSLREHAVRDPRLVTALGSTPEVRVKVGWLFTKDHSTAAVGLSELAVGDVAFPFGSGERPTWLPTVLADIGRRVHRVVDEPLEDIVERLLAASLSEDPQTRERFRRAAKALGEPPFSIGALELVRAEGRMQACFGPDLLRARQIGPAAAEALRLVEAVYIVAPDVLVVEAAGALQADPEAARSWLRKATEGDDATLEQVLLVPGGGA